MASLQQKNRSMYIQEIFQPSDERPIPSYTHSRERAYTGHRTREFRHTLHLPGGRYDIGMDYLEQTRLLELFFAKDGSFRPLPGGELRLPFTVKQDTQDLIQVIRAMSQMIMKICRDYPVQTIAFTAELNLPERLSFFDHLASALSRHYNGQLIVRPDPEGISRVYRIILPTQEERPSFSPRLLSWFRKYGKR